MQQTKSTCPYCGVGCGVVIETEGNAITGVRGDPDHPANFGRLCTKGATLHLSASPSVTRQMRLLQPLVRATRTQAPAPIAWDSALDLAANRFAGTIAAHGPDAVGFYVSGQLLTEDYYVFNKLAKGLVGTNNIDTNSRLCMSSAAAGYKATLGADAPPACYGDLQHADCLFIIGSNTAWAHPVLFRRIEDARAARPDMKVIVVDPRRTDTAACADLFLQIQPGSDAVLMAGMLHLMQRQAWLDTDYIAAHTSGFAALQPQLAACTPERVARECGIALADLVQAARWFAGVGDTTAPRGRTLSLYCQGLNQSSAGTANNAALVHLHLATGQIGKPGAGPLSLTGQANAMGGREVGGMSNLLSGHRDMANPEHRAEVAALWGLSEVPARPGKTAVEMFEAAADGEIRALWIACTNPAQSLPHQSAVRRALERAEFVVLQEAFAHTATAAYADLLLPASTWGEKTGTVTNSERCISRVRSAVPAAGEARHDWQIALQFAQRLEQRLRPGAPTLFPYADHLASAEAATEAIWNEHRESTRGRDLDITGLSYARLDAAGPQQWPLPDGATHGRKRLYEDGVFPTPDGRARFAVLAAQGLAESPGLRYPFLLTTGRLRDQWHGMSRTGTVARLSGHAGTPCVQMHAGDMARQGLQEGALACVTSARASIVLPAHASAEIAPGQAFIAMHWGSDWLGGQSAAGRALAGVNALTTQVRCPISQQPALKHTAVKILKVDLPWQLCAMAWFPEDEALRARTALAGLMDAFAFASCTLFAAPSTSGTPARTGVCLTAAGHYAAPDALLERIEALLGLASEGTLRYADRRRGQRRAARLVRGAAHSTLGAAAGARQVCSCLGVSEGAIADALTRLVGDAAARLSALQAQLRCGTQCGSCVPELRRLVQGTPAQASAA